MKLLKERRGFTLVELLGVLVVLGLLAVICYPIITNVITKQKNELTKEQKNRIINAAKNYVASGLGTFDSNDTACVSISDLQTGGFLESGDIQNPNGGTLTGNVQIKWSDTYNQYEYEYGGC